MPHFDPSFTNRNISGNTHSASNRNRSELPLPPNSIDHPTTPQTSGDQVSIHTEQQNSISEYAQHRSLRDHTLSDAVSHWNRGTFSQEMAHHLLRSNGFLKSKAVEAPEIKAELQEMRKGLPSGYDSGYDSGYGSSDES